RGEPLPSSTDMRDSKNRAPGNQATALAPPLRDAGAARRAYNEFAHRACPGPPQDIWREGRPPGWRGKPCRLPCLERRGEEPAARGQGYVHEPPRDPPALSAPLPARARARADGGGPLRPA